MGKKDEKLSVPQTKAFISNAKSVATVAGFGSGKTHTALLKAFDLLYIYKGVPIGYAAPTYGMINDIWYPAVEEHCDKHGLDYTINKKANVVRVYGLGSIVCRSLSNPNKIVGFQVGDFLIDEIDILRKDVALNAWRKCKARCRVKFPKKKKRKFPDVSGPLLKGEKWRKPNQMHCYTTPEGFKATYELFKNEKTKLKNSELIQMSTYSNLHNLPKDYIDELKANYPPQLVDAYIEGIFTNLLSGTVYYTFDRVLNAANNIFINKGEVLYVGMDFNVQNMSAIIHIIRNNTVYAVDELVRIYDTPSIIVALKEKYGKDHQIVVYPDATGKGRNTTDASKSDLSLLKNHFHVRVNNSNPSIRDRTNSMNAMFCNALGQRRYLVNTLMCPTYTENLEQQCYDDNGLPDKTMNHDHTNDAAGYFINREFGITKPIARTTKLTM